MALYRTVSMSFWTDSKVVDDFSPEDRYFYLYLFTNPHTNLCGCYEISKKQMSIETGYTVDTINILLERFENTHDIIRYSPKTKELLLLNWHKYNWTASEKFRKPLGKEIQGVKQQNFKEYLQGIFDGKDVRYGIDTNCIDTSVTVTVTDTVSVTDANTVNNTNNNSLEVVTGEVVSEKEKSVKEIVCYLNEQAGTHFRANTAGTTRLINARLNEGFGVEDFKKVIDNKVYEWKGTDQEQYLRPETLFATSHFESYLNQKPVRKRTTGAIDWDNI